jgi:cytochrome c biogenesis factor
VVTLLPSLIAAVCCGLATRRVAERRGIVAWPWVLLSLAFLLLGLLATVLLADRLGRPIPVE